MSQKRRVSIPDDYPDRVFTLRRRVRLTQEQFAEHIGVPSNSIEGWEAGRNRPSRTAWCRILRLTNNMQSPHDDPKVKIIPDWHDKPIRVNISHIASYRQVREADLKGKAPPYELFEYTRLNMVGGHSHVVHMCAVEFDNMFAVDTRYY